MKKFLFVICFLLFSHTPVLASEIPEKIVLHNVLNYEAGDLQIGNYVQPKINIQLYSIPGDPQSAVIGELAPDEFALVRSYQLHTFPRQNSFILTKRIKDFAVDNTHIRNIQPAKHDEIYFLTYRGEGYFQALWQGHIIWLQPKYQVNIRGTQLWLCLQHPETGLEGWVMVNEGDWQEGDFTIFFKEKKTDDNQFFTKNK